MRRRIKPDTRPRWNNPNLKILYAGKWHTAEEYQKLCVAAFEWQKNWNEPSYWWNRKGKEK